jgi:uncharacterized protein (DUF4415 family)
MTERKRSKAEERAYAELRPALRELRQLQMEMRVDYLQLQLDTIPNGWRHIEAEVPVRPRKVRVNASYDADVARFFRAMGHGYQARMNAVLRAYMLAILSREIKTRKNEDWMGREI